MGAKTALLPIVLALTLTCCSDIDTAQPATKSTETAAPQPAAPAQAPVDAVATSPPAPQAAPPAQSAKAIDLVTRSEAVDYWGPRDRDYLPPGLRAIADERVKRGPSCIPEIEEALPLSVNLRRTAPEALYHWPSDKTRAILIRQLDDPDEQAAHHAAYGLGVMGGPEVVKPLLDAASKPGSTVRQQVFGAMRRLPAGTADVAYDLIATGLSDPGYWIRSASAEALVYLKSKEKRAAAAALAAKALETEKDERVKAALQKSIEALKR